MFTFWESPVSFVCLVRPYSWASFLQIPFLFGSLKPISASIGIELRIALTRFWIGSRLGGSPDVLSVVAVLPLGVLSLPHPLCNHPLAVQLVQNHHPEKWKLNLEVNIETWLQWKPAGKRERLQTGGEQVWCGQMALFLLQNTNSKVSICAKQQIPKYNLRHCALFKAADPWIPPPTLGTLSMLKKMSTT